MNFFYKIFKSISGNGTATVSKPDHILNNAKSKENQKVLLGNIVDQIISKEAKKIIANKYAYLIPTGRDIKYRLESETSSIDGTLSVDYYTNTRKILTGIYGYILDSIALTNQEKKEITERLHQEIIKWENGNNDDDPSDTPPSIKNTPTKRKTIVGRLKIKSRKKIKDISQFIINGISECLGFDFNKISINVFYLILFVQLIHFTMILAILNILNLNIFFVIGYIVFAIFLDLKLLYIGKVPPDIKSRKNLGEKNYQSIKVNKMRNSKINKIKVLIISFRIDAAIHAVNLFYDNCRSKLNSPPSKMKSKEVLSPWKTIDPKINKEIAMARQHVRILVLCDELRTIFNDFELTPKFKFYNNSLKVSHYSNGTRKEVKVIKGGRLLELLIKWKLLSKWKYSRNFILSKLKTHYHIKENEMLILNFKDAFYSVTECDESNNIQWRSMSIKEIKEFIEN